jgi:hypothetical protein
MPIPGGRFIEVAVDFVGPIPECKGYDTILSVTDRFTGYVHLLAVHSMDTAQQIAETFYLNWCRTFDLPEAITSDHDKLFTSHFWTELLHKLRIQRHMSMAAHPETDGSSEQSNKMSIEFLWHYVNARQTDWADHLIGVEMCINNSKNASTGKSLTELLFSSLFGSYLVHVLRPILSPLSPNSWNVST